MTILYIISFITVNVFFVYKLLRVLWKYTYNKRNCIVFNICGLTFLTSGFLLLPFNPNFVYLAGLGIINCLYSLFFTNWVGLLHNLTRMYFNELKGEKGFIDEIRIEKPGSIYHPLFSNNYPYAYIEKIDEETLTIQRYSSIEKIQVGIKDFYRELADLKLNAIGGKLKG